ncbi:MAG TPA: DCC1-like thiol-disulfide oxidoreductase family protein [candidate division Zixibacteria bacterium]|nr:DCC1-like thiol-disulfide oxidoreductase family protein [candidate division Zixibacteria bacterium]
MFFDGICNLCNGFVDLLLTLDRERRLRFAPLQGSTARALDVNVKAESVIVIDSGGAWRDSDAVLRAVGFLPQPFRSLRYLRFTPRYLRDRIYAFIAERRYRWFGRRSVCRTPDPVNRERFLP